MASGIYNTAKDYMMDGTIDLEDATGNAFRVVLVDDYTFDASHSTYSDVSGSEISGTGYTAGGAGISSPAVSQSGGSGKWDAGDAEWTSASFTADGAVVVYTDDGTTDAGDYLVCYIDLGGDHTVTSGTFTLVWGSAGILAWS